MTLAATHLDRRTPKPQTSKSAEQTFHDNQDLNRCISSNFGLASYRSNDAVEQAFSKTSLAELVRGVG